MLRHFAVTTSFWRGVADLASCRRPIRRACDWHLYRPCAGDRCPDCLAYVEALRRMGVAVFQPQGARA